jgi:hypothetical protein
VSTSSEAGATLVATTLALPRMWLLVLPRTMQDTVRTLRAAERWRHARPSLAPLSTRG